MPLSLIQHPDSHQRCSWCNQGEAFADYIRYHDDEWGQRVADERRLFEKITLEGFQSGLSWLTVLRKRDRFREVFEGFEFEKVARFSAPDIERLVLDAGIIRHRGKIVSATKNAQQNHARAGRYAGPDARVAGIERSIEEVGLELCRPHDDVRLHAVDGCGE